VVWHFPTLFPPSGNVPGPPVDRCDLPVVIENNSSFKDDSMTAAMEHHFDNHEFCNPLWCHFQEDSIQKSDIAVCGKLRNVHSNSANQIVYDEVKNTQYIHYT